MYCDGENATGAVLLPLLSASQGYIENKIIICQKQCTVLFVYVFITLFHCNNQVRIEMDNNQLE